MTFSKWRSYSYKPLESRTRRRNTIAGAATDLSGSVSREERSHSPAAVENGTTPNSCSNGDAHAPRTISPTDPFSGELISNGHHREQEGGVLAATRGARRTRSLSVPSWTASLLRSRLTLRRRPSGTRRLRSSRSSSPAQRDEDQETAAAAREEEEEEEEEEGESDGGSSCQLETDDQQLESVLREAWGTVLSAGEVAYGSGGFLRRKQALEYSRKMADIRQQYQLKLAEIQQREATFAREFLAHDEATPLLRADELTAPLELQRAIQRTQSSGKFDKLRLELKRETAASVALLRSRYPSLEPRLREGGRDKPRRPRSCIIWPSSPSSPSLVYCNPHTEEAVQQSESMVGIFDGLYATENCSYHESLCLSDSKIGETNH